jgi:hypothetical protein
MKRLILLFALFTALPVFAQEHLFYKELNLVGGYSHNDKWVDKTDAQYTSLGFEDYRKFSNDYGDFLTTDLQARLAYDSLMAARNAFGLQVHNAWGQFNLGNGKKITLGHFDPAFGLETILDTHATLLRTLIERDIGFDKDWGIGFKGFNNWFDYQAALQLGSGMSVDRRDNSFLSTLRLSKPAGGNWQLGISAMYGNVLETMGMSTIPRNDLASDNAVVKKRIGLDSQYLYGPWVFKGEVAYGTDDRRDVVGYMVESDYTLPQNQNLELELQLQSWFNNLRQRRSDDTTLTAGAAYKLNKDITLRIAYAHDLNRMGGSKDEEIIFQFYFFGR